MLLFLAKLLYLVLSIIAFPINFIRVLLYKYIGNRAYRKIVENISKTWGVKKP